MSDPSEPEHWFTVPNVCGSCIAWRSEGRKADQPVAIGACKLRPELGRVPGGLKKCDRYMQRGGFSYTPKADPTKRKRAKVLENSVVKRTTEGEEEVRVPARRAPLAPLPPPRPFERPRAPLTIDLGPGESLPVARQALVELVRLELGNSRRELHPRFARGGRVILTATDGTTLSTSAERLFSMLDRLKSALEACEGAIGARRAAVGEETDELVASLRAMQGSMTTFNVLFGHREDYFSSKE